MFWSFLFLFYAILRRHAGERDSDLHVDGRLAQGDHRTGQRGQPRCQEVSLSLGRCLLRIRGHLLRIGILPFGSFRIILQ